MTGPKISLKFGKKMHINMHNVTIPKTSLYWDRGKPQRGFYLKLAITWVTEMKTNVKYRLSIWRRHYTEKCKYGLYPHHKHSHADRHHTLPCAPPFSIACPHLPPAGSRVNVAGVAQSCLIDEACDKQANWGGREDVLQRPAEHPTWQVMLFMPLYAFPASQSECSRKNRAELVFWRLRILVWGGGGGVRQPLAGFVSCFG